MKEIKEIWIKFQDGSYKGYSYRAFLEWLKESIREIKHEKIIDIQEGIERVGRG